MDFFFRPLYRFFVYPAILCGAKIGSLFHQKLANGFSIHRKALERWKEKAARLNHEKAILWFHATSTGEFEAARPVMEAIRRRAQDRVSIVFTYYSPTVHQAAGAYSAADLREVLPLDTTSEVRQVLEAVRPQAIIFVRYDTWPNLIWRASDLGIPLFLIDALLRKKSFRFSGPLGRSFSRSLYSKFHYIGAVSSNDADRLRFLTGHPERVHTVGDSRFDRIQERQRDSRRLSIPESLASFPGSLLICGSTWPGDEKRILPAVRNLLGQDFHFHTVLVPHEVGRARIGSVIRALERHRLSWRLYSEVQRGGSPQAVTILDATGFLAEFYRIGTFCYVGGGFLASGVHNCVEPAVMGLPLCFGPRHHNAPEAEYLIGLGGAHEIRTAQDLMAVLGSWLGDRTLLSKEGDVARRYVEQNLGASEKYAEEILKIVL